MDHTGLSHLLARIGLFSATTLAAYSGFAILFGLFCLVGGHNMMEALYGGFASFLLALVVGDGGVWVWTSIARFNQRRD